jgi:hypothetical protein
VLNVLIFSGIIPHKGDKLLPGGVTTARAKLVRMEMAGSIFGETSQPAGRFARATEIIIIIAVAQSKF